MSWSVGRSYQADLSTCRLPSPGWIYAALWSGGLETTVGGKANRLVLVLLKENMSNPVDALGSFAEQAVLQPPHCSVTPCSWS